MVNSEYERLIDKQRKFLQTFGRDAEGKFYSQRCSWNGVGLLLNDKWQNKSGFAIGEKKKAKGKEITHNQSSKGIKVSESRRTKSWKIGRNSIRSKGSKDQLKGSEGQQEGSEGLPKGLRAFQKGPWAYGKA